MKSYDHSPGVWFDLTAKEARAALRNAKEVYVGVVVFEGGDPQYIPTSRAEMLRQLRGVPDDEVTTARTDTLEGFVRIHFH